VQRLQKALRSEETTDSSSSSTITITVSTAVFTRVVALFRDHYTCRNNTTINTQSMDIIMTILHFSLEFASEASAAGEVAAEFPYARSKNAWQGRER
jgi:hypothetical protein